MASQLDLLRESVARLEAEGVSADSPYVQGLRAQILRLERDQRRRETGGYFGEDGKIKPQWMNPMG